MKRPPFFLFEFWDHSDGREPLLTWVAGFLLRETPSHYYVTTWLAGDDLEEVVMNEDPVAIVKGALTRRPLKLDSAVRAKWGKVGK